MATSGIENVVRLWEPKPRNGVPESDFRVVSDVIKMSKENQHRMGVDPFEVMLMRMGFRLAMEEAVEIPGRQGVEEGGGVEVRHPVVVGVAGQHDDPMGDDNENDLRWVEQPANCRQS